jgi:uncharacterized protein YbjT (DUF2867 family)
VTGGTGFVGSHLIALARTRGYPCVRLTRKWKPPEEGVEWVEGTLDRPESLRGCAKARRRHPHCGRHQRADRAGFEAVNAGGTANMIDAARKQGLRRFIHISSLSAREPDLSDYGWSKARSERLVAASGLAWTIIRPPAIYGPGDRETFELFRMAKRGLVPLPPKGRMSVIHADDLCRLILDLLDADDSWGETYEPDDGAEQGWDHRDFARALGEAFGKRAVPLSMPRLALRAASGADRLLRRGNAKLTADRVSYFCHPDWVAAHDKRPPPQLWQAQVPTPEGLAATADWYREQGWLK